MFDTYLSRVTEKHSLSPTTKIHFKLSRRRSLLFSILLLLLLLEGIVKPKKLIERCYLFCIMPDTTNDT